MPVFKAASSPEEFKQMTNDELTTVSIVSNGTLHALMFMQAHKIPLERMIQSIPESNSAVEPLLKSRKIDLVFEHDGSKHNPKAWPS